MLSGLRDCGVRPHVYRASLTPDLTPNACSSITTAIDMSDVSKASQDVIHSTLDSDIDIKAQHTTVGDTLVSVGDAKDEEAGALERKLQPEREATFKDYLVCIADSGSFFIAD